MFVEMIQGGNPEDDGTYGPLIIVAALFAVGGLLIKDSIRIGKKIQNNHFLFNTKTMVLFHIIDMKT